jgi:hypothetical protein
MLNSAFLKRILPFVGTFALGLFIASFFVSILPTFKFRKNRCGNKGEIQRLRYEKERLQVENQRLQQRLEESEKMILLEAPMAPPPPAVPKVIIMPMESVPAAPRAR